MKLKITGGVRMNTIERHTFLTGSITCLALFLVFSATIIILPGFLFADTSAVSFVEDIELERAIMHVRKEFLAQRDFDQLDVTLLIPLTETQWRRGSYNGETLSYPASCVKLAYLAAAMHWCRTNGHPYDYLDYCVRPMIKRSDNEQTGVVVDIISGVTNDTSLTSVNETFKKWYEQRLYTEKFLQSHGLLENQTIMHKTYPSNSGKTPTGAEKTAIDYRGRNMMQPKCSASLMLEIVKGVIEPGAQEYMLELLQHERWSDSSVLGFGLPPGSVYLNEIGVAYDTVEDIAYVILPNGKEFILAVYSNARDRTQYIPHDASSLGVFCEMLIERLGLDEGNPVKIIIDDDNPEFQEVGNWHTMTSHKQQYGTSYKYMAPGDGSKGALWNIHVPEAGRYEVCVWYPQGENHASAAPYVVNHAGGGRA